MSAESFITIAAVLGPLIGVMLYIKKEICKDITELKQDFKDHIKEFRNERS